MYVQISFKLFFNLCSISSMKLKLLLFVGLLSFVAIANAQLPELLFEDSFGGTKDENFDNLKKHWMVVTFLEVILIQLMET